jgi:hypothetical protein
VIYVVPLLVFVLSVPLLLGAAWWQGREDMHRLGELARQDPPPPELHWCQHCGHRHYGKGPLGCGPGYGPFPVDTGPLLIVGDALAANDALEREVKAMIRAAEREIGPVQ